MLSEWKDCLGGDRIWNIETKRKAMHDSRREGKLQEVFPVSLGKTGRQLEREKGFNCLVIL